jgi:hypothetical protein
MRAMRSSFPALWRTRQRDIYSQLFRARGSQKTLILAEE